MLKMLYDILMLQVVYSCYQMDVINMLQIGDNVDDVMNDFEFG